MDTLTVRIFEQTQLTKDVLNGLVIALENMPECHLKDKLIQLVDKIEDNKLDVRLSPRDD